MPAIKGLSNRGKALTDPSGPKAALDRITVSQDTFDQITRMVSPRSSLIVSDETLSTETGQGTDFVVLMSGEPQGTDGAVRRSKSVMSVRASGHLIGDRHMLVRTPLGE